MTETARTARQIVADAPFRALMHVTMRDGSQRIGIMKYRGRHGFTVSDTIWSIPYEDVAAINGEETADYSKEA